MANWTRDLLLVAVPLSMNFGRVDERKKNNVGWPLPNEELLAASLREPEICYILDGILFLYGIILTALYCRIKIYNTREENLMRKQQQGVEEGIYTGLTPHAQDTYETIGMKK